MAHYFLFIFNYVFTEWTGTTLKFLKDQIPKLQEYYCQNEKPANSTINAVHTNETEQKLALRHWNYCTRLLKYMYEEGMYMYLFKFSFFLQKVPSPFVYQNL